ncbi:unnamed protein product, partial [Brenthis ino]
MIAYKGREGKRGRNLKMSRHLERLYKEGKCRDCSVVVTRMDFAKILGKFTKVKIQYESSSSPKTQKTAESPAPNSNARLKNNENGMVLIHRNVYSQHPVKDLSNSKKPKINEASTPRQVSNVLKENNGPKITSLLTDRKTNHNEMQKLNQNNNKHYAIIFNDPKSNNNIDIKCDLTLTDLLPNIDKRILPTEDWCIDYFPKNDEPTDDKVYDRIAAELEDLMYNEKPEVKYSKSDATDSKVDDFPSIMDILNDNSASVTNSEPKDQSNNIEFKGNLESSDVEAMLLGKANDSKIIEPSPSMEVDNTDVNKLIEDVVQFSATVEMEKKEVNELSEVENPHSPSILDEALQKGIEEHLPSHHSPLKDNNANDNTINKIPELNHKTENGIDNVKSTINSNSNENTVKPEPLTVQSICPALKIKEVTHVIFKKVVNGVCQKSVTCPKNLKYSIEIEEKSVEFLGAPKYISSLEDLQINELSLLVRNNGRPAAMASTAPFARYPIVSFCALRNGSL